MINWPQLGKDSALLLLSLPCILTEFLNLRLGLCLLQVLVCKVLVCKIARQKHPFYFDGELVADIDRCCK